MRTGTNLEITHEDQIRSIDISWLVVSNKFGIIGLILVLFFVCQTLYRFSFISVAKKHKKYFLSAGIFLFSLLSYAHSSPMIVRPFDYGFMISIVIISAIYRENKKPKIRRLS